VVQRLEQDFKATLQQHSSLEQWATWLDNVVTQALEPYDHRTSFPKAARQFLLNWSFYRWGRPGALLLSENEFDFPSFVFEFLFYFILIFMCFTCC
jgi:hypothetical protein